MFPPPKSERNSCFKTQKFKKPLNKQNRKKNEIKTKFYIFELSSDDKLIRLGEICIIYNNKKKTRRNLSTDDLWSCRVLFLERLNEFQWLFKSLGGSIQILSFGRDTCAHNPTHKKGGNVMKKHFITVIFLKKKTKKKQMNNYDTSVITVPELGDSVSRLAMRKTADGEQLEKLWL